MTMTIVILNVIGVLHFVREIYIIKFLKPMYKILSTIVKRTWSPIYRRTINTERICFDACQGSAVDQVSGVDNLKPLQYESHTLRAHDNKRRQTLYNFGLYVATCLPKYVQRVQIQHTDELEILICPEGLYQVCSFLRLHHNCCFEQAISATAVDVPSRTYRFQITYFLLSLRYSERCRVITYTDELTPLRSQFANWKASDWHEREIYDLFGVVFTHHPDLRRILTDYGFAGHPFRKDFPLVGYNEIRYDDELKKLVYEPIEFAQEMRRFNIRSPWHYLRNFHEGYNEPPAPPKEKK